jgi:hypothetical protein
MEDELKFSYDFHSWPRNLAGASTVFIGFRPMPDDTFEWQVAGTESFEKGETFKLIRQLVNRPGAKNARVRVDAYQTPSESDARESLISLLGRSQRPKLARGPDDLGEISFLDSVAAPTYACWVRGNMCLVVSNFGKDVVSVLDYAKRLDERLRRTPDSEESCLSLSPEISSVPIDGEVEISYALPWHLGDQGYLKFLAFGGRLSIKGKRLYLRGELPGDATILGFAVEPSQRSCRGLTVIAIR